MLSPGFENRFRKDIKRVQKRGKDYEGDRLKNQLHISFYFLRTEE